MISTAANDLTGWEGEKKLELLPKDSGLGFSNDEGVLDRFRKVTPRNLAFAAIDALMPDILRRRSGARRALSSTAWLDGLRGWAALVVCMVHLTVYTHTVRNSLDNSFSPFSGRISLAPSKIPTVNVHMELLQRQAGYCTFVEGTLDLPKKPPRTLNCATTISCSEFRNTTTHQRRSQSFGPSSQAAISPSWSSSSFQAT